MRELKFILCLFFFAGLSAVQLHAQTQPALPFNTSLYHWNHHWFQWTPKHPVYESIEVMSQDNPNNPNYKLVWAFFTERAGKKRQVHYFNNAEVAKNWGREGEETYFRDIEYETKGRYGSPLDLRVKFKDKDNKLVNWEALFDQKKDLQKAGLTDQSGHASASLFLIFFREKAVMTTNSKLTINKEDFSFQKPAGDRKYSFQCSYSFNIYTAIINYDSFTTDYQESTFKSSKGRFFKLAADRETYQSNSFGYQNVIELSASGGQLSSYKHINQKNVFRIDFEPALPNFKSAVADKKIIYKMSLDDFSNIITGVLTVRKVGDDVVYEWKNQTPQWTKSYSFTSSVKCSGNKCETMIKPN